MSQWFGIVFFGIGILIYRSTGDPTLLGSIIVSVVSMGIGGGLGALYDEKFGKYDYNVMYFIDNVLWLFVFCVPGALLGSLVDSTSSYLIYGTWNGPIHSTTILIIMVLTSLIFTYKKMRSKQRKRFQQNESEEL